MTNLTIFNGDNSQTIELTGVTDSTGTPITTATITGSLERSGTVLTGGNITFTASATAGDYTAILDSFDAPAGGARLTINGSANGAVFSTSTFVTIADRCI